ncbi:MAG: ammonia-forming cytochrome c nitrite reductase [Azoarcus sp.]|jgi:nitrite reductase (cytochrome c-552)|nr:ammonia-forming cytochrome c nitrite reductase [Azoarcus sp.]
MNNPVKTNKRNPSIGWGFLFIVMAIVFLLGLLTASIMERRTENASVFNNKRADIPGAAPAFVASSEPNDKMKVEISKTGIDSHNDLWGANYPREYDTWKKTREMDFKSKHLGNGVEDLLEARPDMVVLWAGFPFSLDYFAPRGHWYTLYDMRKSLRVGSPGVGENKDVMTGTCWTCKGPDVPRMMQELGIGKFYTARWSELGPDIVNPLGCADCHDPKTMNLTITRPALVEAFRRRGEDVTKASPNEMRSLVCAQCHVEYYFAEGGNRYITFPWDRGFTVEDMEKYYDEDARFSDWTHTLSKAPMLKAQHPDYELYLLGTHGKRGISCADCHMPRKTKDGLKYTDHQITSPLKNVAGTCQTCHRESEEKLKSYVHDHQDKILEIRNRVEPELAKAHLMAKAALEGGATMDEMKPAHKLLRHATWRWDYGVASHGASFHAPVETARILATALDKSLLAQIELQKLLTSRNITFSMPDISTREKAQAYIGLDMAKLNADKAEFMKTVVPGWIEDARQKGKLTEPDLLDQYK